MNKKCEECENVYVATKSNQKFCSDSCRISYNNKLLKLSKNNIERLIDKKIKANHKIFSALLEDNDECEVHRQFLLGRGVSFEFLTCLYKRNSDGLIILGLYDVGYYKNQEKDEFFNVVRINQEDYETINYYENN
jgi:hypothetical protein